MKKNASGYNAGKGIKSRLASFFSINKRKIISGTVISALAAVLVAVLGSFVAYGEFEAYAFLRYTSFLFCTFELALFISILASLVGGSIGAFIGTFISGIYISLIAGLALYAVTSSSFNFSKMNWKLIFARFYKSSSYYSGATVVFVIFVLVYYLVINKEELKDLFGRTRGLRGKGKLDQIEANLENSRWMTDKERDSIFKPCK